MHKPTILKTLRQMTLSGRVGSLLRAIDSPKSSNDKVRRSADALIAMLAKGELEENAGEQASEGLFRRWRSLSEVQRARLMRIGARRWRAGLARVETDSDSRLRSMVAGLAGKWPVGEAIRAAGRLIDDPHVGVADQAEESLLRVCARAVDLDKDAAEALDETLARLAGRYDEHRRRGLLRAVLGLGAASGPAVREWLRQGGEHEMMPLRAVVKEAGVVSRADAVRLLGEPGLRAAAAGRLSSSASARDHETTLSCAPLLLARNRVHALKRLEQPLSALPGQDELERLSVPARVGALWWAALAPAPSGARATALAEMMRDTEPLVRFGAVRRLGSLAEGSSTALDALKNAAFDSDARVALAALREIGRFDPDTLTTLARSLERSPLAPVRFEAKRALEGDDAWAMIEAGHSEGWRALRVRMANDPLRTLGELRGRVLEGEARSRTLAVMASRRLGVTGEIETELLGAARDDDPRVVASAVMALGDHDTAPARATVSSSLAHADPRVRANAVEAIARRDPDEPVVRAWVDNEVPRSRGNAVRARVVLARDPRGREALERMLGDSARGHRLSGLWVAERAGAVGVSQRVAELARTESDPQVRGRAKRCARRLLAEMRLHGADAPAGASLA